jgi:hypothetical protein
MLGDKGYYRGGTLMISGAAGTGKSSLAAHFVDAACRRGERCLYFAFEESPSQVARNMRSIGIDLDKWVRRGLLRISAARPATFGIELHISMMLNQIEEFTRRLLACARHPQPAIETLAPMSDRRIATLASPACPQPPDLPPRVLIRIRQRVTPSGHHRQCTPRHRGQRHFPHSARHHSANLSRGFLP